jgi:hypothetical protein
MQLPLPVFYTAGEGCRNVAMAALTITDAAKAIGHSSRSQLYRLMKDGVLDDFIRDSNGRRLLEVNGLAAAVREATQQRSNSVTIVDAESGTDWDAIAAICNGWLDADSWGKPPWDGTRWATLFWCVQDAAQELTLSDDDESSFSD